MHGTLAILTTAPERYDAAEQHYIEAIATNDATHHYLWATRTQRSYADMLLRRNGEGDRERALELLQQTLDVAQTMGMKKVVEDCLALKMNAQGVMSGSIYTSIDTVTRAVEAEKPDLRTHAAPDGTVTIMFSDTEDSTVLTERLCDEAWQELLRKHNGLIREQLQAYGGYEVKTRATTSWSPSSPPRRVSIASSPSSASSTTTTLRTASASRSASACTLARRSRTGRLLRENLIMALRVAGKGVGGDIPVSSLLRQLVESSVGPLKREAELKGLSGRHTLYAITAT